MKKDFSKRTFRPRFEKPTIFLTFFYLTIEERKKIVAFPMMRLQVLRTTSLLYRTHKQQVPVLCKDIQISRFR